MLKNLQHYIDPGTAQTRGGSVVERRLRDLQGVFADQDEYRRMLETEGNVLVYTVETLDYGDGEGDLRYGLGMIRPGHIGTEYFMTRGHMHERAEAAEVYIGLRGQGEMLLEDAATGESQTLPIGPHSIVYVPGNTLHRTINTGREPLTYIGVYSARAGHDYTAVQTRNFRKVVAEIDGHAHLLDREEFLRVRGIESPAPSDDTAQ